MSLVSRRLLQLRAFDHRNLIERQRYAILGQVDRVPSKNPPSVARPLKLT